MVKFLCHCITQRSSEKQKQQDVGIDIDIDIGTERLLWGIGSYNYRGCQVQICRVAQRSRNLGEVICCSSSLKVGRREAQGTQCSSLNLKAIFCITRKNWYHNEVQRQSAGEVSLARKKPVFLIYSRLQLIAWGSPTLWRVICFTQSPLI